MEKSQSKLFLFATISLIVLSYNSVAFAEDGVIVEFLEDSYSYDGTVVIRITDLGTGDNNTIDSVDIVVSSDADTVGTTITLQETDSASGIFEGTVFFVLDDYTSGHRLQVVQGGQIYASYKDTSAAASIDGTPSPITDTTELEEGKSDFTKTTEENEVSESVVRPDAYLEWIGESYSSSDTGIIRVVDEYMNQNTEKIETLSVMIYSEERAEEGITVELTETSDSSGIFEGTMFFTTTDTSVGHRLHVVPGDIITAEYLYASDPDSDLLDIGVGDEVLITGIPSLKIQLERGIDVKNILCSNPEHVLSERPNGKLSCVYTSTAEKLNWQILN